MRNVGVKELGSSVLDTAVALLFFSKKKKIPDTDRVPAWAEIRVVIDKSQMTVSFLNDRKRYLAEQEALLFWNESCEMTKK